MNRSGTCDLVLSLSSNSGQRGNAQSVHQGWSITGP